MKIADLKNSRLGTIGFVIGAGPSLHFEDLSIIKYHTRIAVNSGVLADPDADFFLTGDPGCSAWSYWQDEVIKKDSIKLFQLDRMSQLAESISDDKKCLYECQLPHHPHFDNKSNKGLDMSVQDKIIGARTSSGAAAHFLHIMGCNPIVLLGCDACYVQNKRYFWQFPGRKKITRKNGSSNFIAALGSKNGMGIDQHCSEFLEYWNMVANLNKDVNIINVSKYSIVDSFPKMLLKDVIEKYG